MVVVNGWSVFFRTQPYFPWKATLLFSGHTLWVRKALRSGILLVEFPPHFPHQEQPLRCSLILELESTRFICTNQPTNCRSWCFVGLTKLNSKLLVICFHVSSRKSICLGEWEALRLHKDEARDNESLLIVQKTDAYRSRIASYHH